VKQKNYKGVRQDVLADLALHDVTIATRARAAESLTDPYLCLGVAVASRDRQIVDIVKKRAGKAPEHKKVLREFLSFDADARQEHDELRAQVAQIFKKAFSARPAILLEYGYWRSAETAYLDRTRNPSKFENSTSIFNQELEDHYNLAILYWSYVGLGDLAMEGFENVWALYEKHAWSDRNNLMIVAYAAENALLLCASVDEFAKWGDRLRGVAPEAKILSEICVTYAERYENGAPWWELMMEVGNAAFYNRTDASQDSGRYGNGAALWQRMVSHKKQLRLPQEPWAYATQEYGILALRLSAQEARAHERWLGRDGYESGWPVYEALPYVEAFVKEHPGDVLETDVLGDMKELLRHSEMDRVRAESVEGR
jgi:hypothetical protein